MGIIGSWVWAQRGRAGQREQQPGSRVGCDGCFGRARLPALSGVAGVASSPRRGSWHGEAPILLASSWHRGYVMLAQSAPSLRAVARHRGLGGTGPPPACRGGATSHCGPPGPLGARGEPAPGALRVFPARFPPLAAVTGAGAEMGGAWGRHKCATAASSLPWLHPSRLLTVALATSYRWGIYRGWEAGGGALGMGGRLLGQPPASGFSRLAWGQEGCCSPWRQRVRCSSFSCSLEPGEVARNLHVEIKISGWDVCPSHRHCLCLEACVQLPDCGTGCTDTDTWNKVKECKLNETALNFLPDV